MRSTEVRTPRSETPYRPDLIGTGTGVTADEADIASLLLMRFPPATGREARQRRDLLLGVDGDVLAVGLLDILEPQDQRVVRPLAQRPGFDRREFRDRLVGMLGIMAGQQAEDGMFWLDA